MDWLDAALWGGSAAACFNAFRLHDELKEMALLVSWPATKLVLIMSTLSFVVGAASADVVRRLGQAGGVAAALLGTPYAFMVSGVALTQLLSLLPISVGRGDLTGLPAWEAVWAYVSRLLKEEIASNRMERSPDLARALRRLGSNPGRLARRMTQQVRATREGAEAEDGVSRINAVLASQGQDRMIRLVELLYILQLRPLLRTLKREIREATPSRRGRSGVRGRVR